MQKSIFWLHACFWHSSFPHQSFHVQSFLMTPQVPQRETNVLLLNVFTHGSAATRYSLILSSQWEKNQIQPLFVQLPGRNQWAAEMPWRGWERAMVSVEGIAGPLGKKPWSISSWIGCSQAAIPSLCSVSGQGLVLTCAGSVGFSCAACSVWLAMINL